MGNAKSRAVVFSLSLLSVACNVRREPSPSLPAITVQQNPDGTQTRQVSAGHLESQAEVERRLLGSIECRNYQIVALGQPAESQGEGLSWVRYRCLTDN